MKYLFPLIIIALLFGSCDITKRRYMSGYSVEWRHKSPKPTIARESAPSLHISSRVAHQVTPVIAEETGRTKEFQKKAIYPLQANLPAINRFHLNSLSASNITYYSHKPISASVYEIDTTLLKKPKGQPHFYTGDEEEDEYAHRSLVEGILALATPAAGFLIMLGIALSVGETIATAPAYAIAIFAFGCAGGLVFAIFAFINGFLGLNEINAQPDLYTGTGDAVLGMILAALEPIGLIAYFLIRFL